MRCPHAASSAAWRSWLLLLAAHRLASDMAVRTCIVKDTGTAVGVDQHCLGITFSVVAAAYCN